MDQKINQLAKISFLRSLPSLWVLICAALVFLPIAANAQVTFEQKSSPAGLFTTSTTSKSLNESVSTSTASLTSSSYSFTHWTINGVRQSVPDGQAKTKSTFSITENTVAIAHYLFGQLLLAPVPFITWAFRSFHALP